MGKIRSLYVRPLRSSDLSFDSPGIIESRSAKVGDIIASVDLQATVLNQLTSASDSTQIRTLLGASPLANIRTASAAASLDQIVIRRTLSFLNRYKHKADIVAAYNAIYNGTADGKISRINRLVQLEQQRAGGVDTAYTTNNMTGVITQADTSLVTYGGNQTSNTYINSLGMRQPVHKVTVTGPVNSTNTIDDTDSVPIKFVGNGWQQIQETQPTYNSQKTDTSLPNQAVRTKFTDLRDLSLENKMRTETTQLNFQDQLIAQTVVNAQVPDLADILDNELKAIDIEVRKAQIAFAYLFLTSPIAGRVTAIFKDVGESVGIGEPVMRIEGQDEILLVGLVQYRAPLLINTSVKITAKEVFEDGGQATIQGNIVAIRGHDANNDEWDVMILAQNTGTNVTMPHGPPRSVVFPLNYHFDRETTDITI
jgi:multidrug efflux pump subunit AcrA (membrane-fusion protein)